MPVSSNSRYFGLAVFDAPDSRGESHPSIALRLAPPSGPTVVYQHTVATLETLEYLAWRCFHSSEAWWRIADANPPVFPLDWRPGNVVVLPVTNDRGRVERTRRF
jgi:hypothetical protein